MLLSVVIPFYGCSARTLCRAVASMGSLGGDDRMEVIVVDDGSPVGVEALREGLRALQVPLPLRVVGQPHQGAAAARNRGLDLATGRFVWFVDADDSVDPVDLRAMLDVLLAAPPGADLVHTGPMRMPRRCGSLRPSARVGSAAVASLPLSGLLVPRSCCLDHTTYFVATGFLRRCALRYPESGNLLEDSRFVLSMLAAARFPVGSVPGLSPYVRQTCPGSTTAGAWSATRSARFLPDIIAFFAALRAFVDAHPEALHGVALYRRYRYVYLRVLAVKGCPWIDIVRFRQAVIAPGERPRDWRERLLFCSAAHRLLAACCRLLRFRKE